MSDGIQRNSTFADRIEKEMKEKLYLIQEALKAIGRIIAGLALLHYRTVFWLLRSGLLLSLFVAIIKMLADIHNALLTIPGILFIATGSIFTVWTHRLVPADPSKKRELITDGSFAVVRHPMYSGMSLVAIGTGMLAINWIVSALMTLYVICMLSFSCAEDEENEELFGEAYVRYRKKVLMTGIFLGMIRLLGEELGHEMHKQQSVS